MFSAALAAAGVWTPTFTVRKAFLSRLLFKYGILFTRSSVSTPHGEYNTSVWWDIWLCYTKMCAHALTLTSEKESCCNRFLQLICFCHEAVSVSLSQVRHITPPHPQPVEHHQLQRLKTSWMEFSHYPQSSFTTPHRKRKTKQKNTRDEPRDFNTKTEEEMPLNFKILRYVRYFYTHIYFSIIRNYKNFG